MGLVFNTAARIQAQTLDETYAFANSLFESNNYAFALKTYERVLFFDKSAQYQSDCYYQLGECNLVLGNYQNAENYYDLAYHNVSDDSLKNEIIFRKVISLLLLQRYNDGLIELFQLGNNLNKEQLQRKQFYLGIAYFGKEQFDKSFDIFKTLVENDSTALTELDILQNKSQKIEKINPKTARILSMIIPGAGQMYAGDFKSGLNSMALTGGIAVFMLVVAINYSFFDAFLSVSPWFTRYYMGGYEGAEKIAIQKKKEKQTEVYQNVLQVIKRSQAR